MRNRRSSRDAEDYLLSDDEFPDEYYEEPNIPAYQLNDRFEDIKFPWLEGVPIKYLEDLSKTSNINIAYFDYLLNNLESKKYNVPGKQVLVHSGILTKADILCLSCYAATATSYNFLWFLNYLLQKDLDSKFMFLNSCLVPEENFHQNETDKVLCELLGNKDYAFSIKIK